MIFKLILRYRSQKTQKKPLIDVLADYFLCDNKITYAKITPRI